MAVKFFGQYLLEKNIINTEQLIAAVEYQASKNLKFGAYALSKGYLTKKDIRKIQNEQRRVDMRFGEVAIQLNILTPAQVNEILTMQKNDHIYIGDALLKKGFITSEVLQRELTLFRENQNEYIAEEIFVPKGVGNPDLMKDVVNITQKMLHRVANLNVKIGDSVLSSKEPTKNFLMTSISIHGDYALKYVLSTSLEISETIASGVMGEDVTDGPLEFVYDGVKEFCNIATGNIVAKITQKGKRVDINPPDEIPYRSDGYHLLNGRKAAFFPLFSTVGDSTLILIEE